MNTHKHQNVAESAGELSADMTQLVALVSSLPVEHRGHLELVLGRVVESTKRRRRILNLVQEALSQLRLDMKYLVFDLEATRRERDKYKALVENSENEQQDDEE